METIEIIAELRKHGLSNGGSLGWHSGLCDEAADRLESLDKRWKITRLERDQARQMRERAERLLAQAQGELLELRRNTEPVVHAHWDCDCEPYHICSNCHHRFSLFDRVPRCPNCGAHMDEEVVE